MELKKIQMKKKQKPTSTYEYIHEEKQKIKKEIEKYKQPNQH